MGILGRAVTHFMQGAVSEDLFRDKDGQKEAGIIGWKQRRTQTHSVHPHFRRTLRRCVVFRGDGPRVMTRKGSQMPRFVFSARSV